MEFKVNEFTAPAIKINYEELEEAIKEKLEEYSGLVVTEDTLSGCKQAQKELAGVRSKIETCRKDYKRQMEAPIKEFEAQCKALVALVEKTETPIKEGIRYFDEQKRDEKKDTALRLIEEVAADAGLNDKFKAQLTVIDKYMNLTAKVKDVKEDLQTRAFALKVEQDREQERVDIIMSVIATENDRINTKLDISDFSSMIVNGLSTSIVIDEVKKRAQKIFDAENPVKEELVEQTAPSVEEPVSAIPNDEKETAAEEMKEINIYTATYCMIGSADQLRSVSAFLKNNGISYEVTDQREVH